MKSVIYTGTESTLHPVAGTLKPGLNLVSDVVADQLLAAGKLSGEFLPQEARPAEVAEAATEPVVKRDRRPERHEKE
jgi:hypothetical protein